MLIVTFYELLREQNWKPFYKAILKTLQIKWNLMPLPRDNSDITVPSQHKKKKDSGQNKISFGSS